LEFISRLYFLRLYMPEKISPAFDQQRHEAESRLQQLTNTLAELSEEQIYNRMSVDLRIKQLQTILKWLAVSQKYFRRK